MDVLARDGEMQLSTERLARDLGVTRGSFYHHFKSRDDFVRSLLRYWAASFTDYVIATVQGSDLQPRERLLYLMKIIRDEQIDRYDTALRGWAVRNPKVANELREVDHARYTFIRELFSDLGFEGDDLEARTRLFLVFESKNSSVYVPEETLRAPDALERRLALYIGQPYEAR